MAGLILIAGNEVLNEDLEDRRNPGLPAGLSGHLIHPLASVCQSQHHGGRLAQQWGLQRAHDGVCCVIVVGGMGGRRELWDTYS